MCNTIVNILMIPDFKGCAELLWRSVFEEGPLLCDWGLMHRQENALERSIKEVPDAREVMNLASVLDKTFCMGDGRALLRGVANQLEVQVPSLGAPGGTRQLTVTKQYLFFGRFYALNQKCSIKRALSMKQLV